MKPSLLLSEATHILSRYFYGDDSPPWTYWDGIENPREEECLAQQIYAMLDGFA